jgi:Xaa-Pro aminopeptidase
MMRKDEDMIRRIKDVTKKEGLDALVLTSKDANFAYATGQAILDGILVIFPEKKPVLFISPLEKQKDSRFSYASLKTFDQDFKKVLRNAKAVGINESFLPVSLYKKVRKALRKGAKTVDVYAALERMRRIKTAREQAAITEACDITCDILNDLITLLRTQRHLFATEGDIRKFLKTRTAGAGCELAYEPIVASGRRGAIPHYFGDKKLVEGFLIIDFGVRVNGYCADVTRTVYLGTPSEKERQAYALVLACQEACISLVKEKWLAAKAGGTGKKGKQRMKGAKNNGKGLQAKDVYACAVQALGKDAKYFTHGLGHGLGLRIHELPNLKKDSEDVLEEGMAFTIEPGIYPGPFGIRIEDDILLKGGVRVLTKGVTKRLVCIP